MYVRECGPLYAMRAAKGEKKSALINGLGRRGEIMHDYSNILISFVAMHG